MRFKEKRLFDGEQSLFYMIGNCVLSYKNAPRGCALGAKVDGCRSNRASARECAKTHSFFIIKTKEIYHGKG